MNYENINCSFQPWQQVLGFDLDSIQGGWPASSVDSVWKSMETAAA
jgi:hypothetical protein